MTLRERLTETLKQFRPEADVTAEVDALVTAVAHWVDSEDAALAIFIGMSLNEGRIVINTAAALAALARKQPTP